MNEDTKTFQELITLHYGTKAQFAREMGINYVTAWRWCRHPNQLNIRQISEISKRTGMSVCEIAQSAAS